jgi:2-methylcitrate dehydratase PrpD
LREAGKRVEPADLAAALQAGYGVMTWLGTALDGPSLLYRGIWPTYLLAPLGAAAVAARLMRLDAEQASHALAVALCRISGGPGAHGGAHAAGASPRWLLVGQAARAGALAALAASEGFAGDLGLLDAPWLERVHGIVPVGLATAVPEDGGVGGLSLKPVCAAKQTQAALDGCRQILASTPADRIARVEIGVPAAYRAMIGHRRVDSRTDRLTSLAYLLAIAAVAPDDLFDLARARRGDEPAVADFMARVEVAADPSLEPFYPKVWPARVRVTVGGAVIERLVTAALGDPDRPLDEPAAIAKVSRLLGAARPAAALARLTGAALAATHDEAALNDLLAALS